jgi:hypothetical protein
MIQPSAGALAFPWIDQNVTPFGVFIPFDNLFKALFSLDALDVSDRLAGRLMYLTEANRLLS